MTTRVLLLRHAITAAPDRFHGAESDVAIGDDGRALVPLVAEKIRAQGPSAIYSSTMKRARETADLIGLSCGLSVQIVPNLHERAIGPLSGSTWSESRAIYEDTRTRWMAGDLDATHEGGESYRQVRDRVLPAFLTLCEQNSGQTIVVVAHGIVIRVLLTSLVEGMAPEHFASIAIENLGVHDLRLVDGSWTMTPFPE